MLFPKCEVNSQRLHTSAWIFPSTSSRPSSESMHPSEPNSSPVPQHLETQLDFFHKLGYSTAQVQAVQQQFGPSTDTDKLLGELVKIGAGQEVKQGPVTTMSVLVPRGDIQAAGPTLLLPCPATSLQSKEESSDDEDALRPVVIDGSNVAMSHGNKEVFSCLGIQLTVDFFLDRGHTEVTVFVPSWRKEQPRPDVPITDQHILRDLERRKILVFTPSRRVAGKRVVCNDDYFIVKLAYESDGIIVSNDMYRDLQGEKPNWKRFIDERLLMYSFVNNKFMPPDDPLGRHGPTLDNFLRRYPKTQKKQLCPYGKKCTFGIKCKFHHPERTKQSNHTVADELRESARHPSTAQKLPSTVSSPLLGQSLLLVEDMARKLTLGPEFAKKDPRNDHGTQVKTNRRSSKKSTSRKEKTSQHSPSDRGSVQHGGSQEQLDSGLGSIDSQPLEGPWCGPKLGHSAQQQYCLPKSAPCSCCSHGLFSQRSTGAFQHHNHKQFSLGPGTSSSSLTIPCGPSHYTSYSVYPTSLPAFSQPMDLQHTRVHSHQTHQQYWSDPFGGHPPAAVHSLPGECSHWDPPQGTQQSSSSTAEERKVVRKKLLAIFSAHLVDTAMNMFPQMMDPQLLVAEILLLQSHNKPLRH